MQLAKILTVRTLATAIMAILVMATPVLRTILTNAQMVLITVTSTRSVSTKTGDSDVDAIAVTRVTVSLVRQTTTVPLLTLIPALHARLMPIARFHNF